MREPTFGRRGTPAVLVSLLLSLAACPRASSDTAGKSDASPTPRVQEAANADEVTRFVDEVPFGPTAIIVQDKAPVRKSPGGELVVTLPAGADVTKLAARGTDDLVCFDEPKPGTRHLMGWVAQAALMDTPGTVPPSPSSVPLVVDDGGVAPNPDRPAPRPSHHHRPHKGGRQPQPH